jgi:hypothetical protein
MPKPKVIALSIPGRKITETSWPRNLVKSVETRKRDLVIRIADWTKDREEPAYDVEVYIHGVYDWNESKTICTRNEGRTKAQAREVAVRFAQDQIAKFLK